MTSRLTPEKQAEWDAHVATMPAHVAEVARKLPAHSCFRSKENPQTHYVIHSYDWNRGSVLVSMSVVHGADSTLPGVQVFGMEPDSLVECGCGNWQQPTDAQVEAMREHFAALQRARDLAPKPPAPDTH